MSTCIYIYTDLSIHQYISMAIYHYINISHYVTISISAFSLSKWSTRATQWSPKVTANPQQVSQMCAKVLKKTTLYELAIHDYITT